VGKELVDAGKDVAGRAGLEGLGPGLSLSESAVESAKVAETLLGAGIAVAHEFAFEVVEDFSFATAAARASAGVGFGGTATSTSPTRSQPDPAS
jgi:hypothetical protein